MRVRPVLYTILLAAVVVLGTMGAQATDYAVGAPSGTPSVNTTNIQTALNSALATAGPNRVLLQSGQTYVVDARLLISGAAKSVTVTSDGATKAILVGPNYTTGADSFEGVFTVNGLTNSSLGFENFTLLPPAFSVTGSGPAVGNTVGIGISDTCSGNNFHFVSMLITGNNNANGPLSTDGTGNLGGFTNPTVFGGSNINVAHTAVLSPLTNNFYLTGVVSSHVNVSGIHVGGTLDVGGAFTINNKFVANNCIFGTSILGSLVDVQGCSSVSMSGCSVVGTIPLDSVAVSNCYAAAVSNYVSTGMAQRGLYLYNVMTSTVKNATMTGSTAPFGTNFRLITVLLVDNDTGFRVLNPTLSVTDCYIGDTNALIHGVHVLFQQTVTLTRTTVKNLTYGSPAVNPPILLGMEFDNCNEVTMDGCLIENLLNASAACTAIDFTFTGLPNPASQSDPIVEPRNFTMRNCHIKDVTFGIFPRAHYVGLIENCVFENFDSHIFSERNGFGRSNNPANVNWGRRSTTIRDCTFTNICNHTLNPTNTTNTYVSGFYMLDDVVTLERVTLNGPTVPVANVWYGLYLNDPLRVTVTDCIFTGWNRSAIFWSAGDTPNVLAHASDIAQAELRVENSYLLGNGHNLGTAVADQTSANGNYIYAPISFFQGNRLVCSNSVIENCGGDAIHALFVSGSSLICSTATAQINDCTFINCRDNLVSVSCDPNQSNVVALNGIYTTGNPLQQTAGGLAPALNLQPASANLSNIFVTGWAGPVVENRYFGSTPGTYTIQNSQLDTIGQNAIQMDNAWNGNLVVSNTTIHNVTAGSGISVQGGGIQSLDGLEVVNAARYGVSVGETSPAPLLGPIHVDTMSNLCLVDNVLGGISIVQGDHLQPAMKLFNSTILGAGAGISYAQQDSQVLSVTDTIIAGRNGVGTGIDIPTVVVNGGAGSPAPRVVVANSALVTDNGHAWGLANAVLVAGGNPGNTITQTSVINGDPKFLSDVPGNPSFLDVDSSYFGDKGTGGAPLSGCADYVGGTVGITSWRLY